MRIFEYLTRSDSKYLGNTMSKRVSLADTSGLDCFLG
jgi:hypothetical protein